LVGAAAEEDARRRVEKSAVRDEESMMIEIMYYRFSERMWFGGTVDSE
jgi:hypothetical protein